MKTITVCLLMLALSPFTSVFPHPLGQILNSYLAAGDSSGRFLIWSFTFLPVIIWAASSEFVSSSIPSWQILTAHAQPIREARDEAFCLKVPLDSLLVWASSEGSGETARMRRLAWTFAARIGDKYQIRLTRSIWQSRLYTYCFYQTRVSIGRAFLPTGFVRRAFQPTVKKIVKIGSHYS